MTESMWRNVVRHHLFWPAAILAALLLLNLPFTPGFFAVHVRNGHLYGSLVSILIFGTPIWLGQPSSVAKRVLCASLPFMQPERLVAEDEVEP